MSKSRLVGLGAAITVAAVAVVAWQVKSIDIPGIRDDSLPILGDTPTDSTIVSDTKVPEASSLAECFDSWRRGGVTLSAENQQTFTSLIQTPSPVAITRYDSSAARSPRPTGLKDGACIVAYQAPGTTAASVSYFTRGIDLKGSATLSGTGDEGYSLYPLVISSDDLRGPRSTATINPDLTLTDLSREIEQSGTAAPQSGDTTGPESTEQCTSTEPAIIDLQTNALGCDDADGVAHEYLGGPVAPGDTTDPLPSGFVCTAGARGAGGTVPVICSGEGGSRVEFAEDFSALDPDF